MNKDIIGSTFKNNADQEYVVLKKGSQNKSGNYKYLIRFTNTGYEKEVEKVEIKRGKIKDKLERSVFGIGIMGEVKMIDHKKEYSIWSGVLERCYHKDSEAYPYYGAKGVTVSERWHIFTNFLSDVKQIEGYDEELFNKNKLELDKDIKQEHLPKSERVYSLDTCTFVTQKENHKYRDIENMKFKFYAISPEGIVQFRNGIKEFCREYPDLNRTSVTRVLKGKDNSYKGWKFNYIEEINKN